MSRFDFNPKEIDIGFPIFPTNRYRMKIGEPKAFEREYTNDAGEVTKNEGVQYLLKVVEPAEFAGKPYNVSFNLNEDYGNQNAMTFLVCAVGLKPNDEGVKAFREKYGDKDFAVDTKEKTGAGEGWHIAKEREIFVDLEKVEIKKGKKAGEQGQGFPKFSPVE